MVKKIISVILSIMILSSMFTGVVFAANEFNFEFTADATKSVKHYSAFWHRHDGSASNDANSYITYMGDRSSYALYDFTDVIPYIYASKGITAFAAYNYRISGMHMIALDDSCEQYINASLTSTIAAKNGMTTGHTVVYDTDTTQVTTKTFDADKDALIAALETGDNGIVAVRFAGVPNAANTQSAGVTLTFAYDKETYLEDIADYLDWSNVSDIPANKIKADTINLPSKLAGCDVTWSSNSPAINVLTGAVTRAESDQAVTLTATLSHGGNTTSKEFNVVVKKEPKTITIPYTNYGAARSGGIIANGIQLNRFIVSGGTWYGVAQLDLTGYEKILKSPDTSVELTLVSELNQVNGNLSDFTVYLAPDTVDSYKADETVYDTLEALGAFNTGRPVLAVDNDNQTISTAGTPVTVDANKQNLISVLNEGGSKNSIVTVYFAPTVQSAMLMNSANAGLTISYYESEVDNTIEPPVITIDGNSVSAKFVSCNFTDVDEGYTALLAVYSDEGELLELADPKQIKGAGRHEITLSASYSSGCIAKAFVWNNLTNATPLLVSTVEDGTGDGTEEAPEDSIDMSGLNVLVDESKITEIKNSTDPLVTQWRAETISDADAALTQGVYDYSKFSTGEMRNIAESMDRVMNLGMAYLLTADVKYSNRAYAEINEFLKMEDWNKESFLDIAEISTIVSIAYNWMYTAWTKPQRDAMAAKLLEAIDYTNKLYKEELPDPNGWIGCSNNWNAVCNGGMAIAAITVMDKNPSLCTQVKDRALSELKYVLNEFAPYGGWEEGPGYWAYTLQYLTALASTLNNTYGTDLGIGNTVGLEETLMLSVSLEGKTAIMNIGDSAEAHVYAPEMFYWADYYENPAVNGAAMWTLNNFNFEPNVFTLIYYNPAYGTSFEKASALYFRGTETVTLESGSAIDDSFIGISGGEGDTNHGHLDSGSVIVDMKGERFICDIGAEHYGKDGYFSTNRYYYYRARPEGHNIFVINPSSEVNGSKTYHGQNSSAYSAITSFDATKKEAVLDLTDAYSRDASSASRKISLNGANIVIEDNITLKSSKEVHWYFHTDATVSISGNTATLTKNGKTITMTFNAGQNSGSLSLVPAARFKSTTKVTDSDNSPIQKLDFKMTNASGAVNVKITIAG